MAKKKRSAFRRAAKAVYRKAVKGYRKRSGLFGSGKSGSLVQPMSIAYGFIRQKTGSMVEGMASKLIGNAAGQYTDNVAYAGICWAGAKFGKGMIREIALDGLKFENALAGFELGKTMGRSVGTNNSSSSYVYG